MKKGKKKAEVQSELIIDIICNSMQKWIKLHRREFDLQMKCCIA